MCHRVSHAGWYAPGMELFRIDADRAARIAEKRTRRLREQVPLFADQVEEVTADQVKAAADRHAEAFEHCCRGLQARGDAFREQVRQVVSPEEFAILEARKSVLPTSPEYHADFWRREAGRVAISK